MDDKQSQSGCAFALVLIGVITLLSYCSNAAKNTSNADTSVPNVETSAVMDASPGDATPLPLDKSAVLRGARQARMVDSLNLDSANETYSRNCYDALGTTFDWHQLDRCGGFDAATSNWAQSNDAYNANAYFDTEASAQRYLAMATSHNLDAGDADVRWESVKRGASHTKRVVVAALPMDDDGDEETENAALAASDTAPSDNMDALGDALRGD